MRRRAAAALLLLGLLLPATTGSRLASPATPQTVGDARGQVLSLSVHTPARRPVRVAGASRGVPILARSQVERIILAAARRYGLDPVRFLATARCESGLRPNVVSGTGRYLGLFQQDRGYWPARARRAGWTGFSPLDARANAFVSAWMVRHGGGYGHWPRCGFL